MAAADSTTFVSPKDIEEGICGLLASTFVSHQYSQQQTTGSDLTAFGIGSEGSDINNRK